MPANHNYRVRGVIFDLDGTLANTLHVSIASFKLALEPLIGRTLSEREIMQTFGPTEEGTVKFLAPDFYDIGIVRYNQEYRKMHSICPEPFEGIVQLLHVLKNHKVKLAIVTGKALESTQISLEVLGLASFFDLIETGSPVQAIKDKSIRNVLSKWSDLDKNEVIYVGDTVVDIESSKKVGIRIASAAWSDLADIQALEKHNPTNIFYSVAAFAYWIKTLI
jgi:phosphoglycolate phosphatase-like HAD superfamily hydrolase